MAAARADRTALIRRLVAEQHIETQQDLVTALARHSVVVTQATISRDIKRLGLLKVPAGDGRSRYTLPAIAPRPRVETERHLRAVLDEFARDVVAALDLVLIKTVPGGAPPVAQAIDDARWQEVAGTLAGEDTIIVVPHSRSQTRALASRLRALMARAR